MASAALWPLESWIGKSSKVDHVERLSGTGFRLPPGRPKDRNWRLHAVLQRRRVQVEKLPICRAQVMFYGVVCSTYPRTTWFFTGKPGFPARPALQICGLACVQRHAAAHSAI